jgi:prolyl-tRNA synthetase
VRRDTREKAFVPLAGLEDDARARLDAIQRDLLVRARRFMADHTTRAATWDEFRRVMADKRGFIVAGWCGDAACEARIKEETKATIRVLPDEEFRSAEAPRHCLKCGKAATAEALWAKAY